MRDAREVLRDRDQYPGWLFVFMRHIARAALEDGTYLPPADLSTFLAVVGNDIRRPTDPVVGWDWESLERLSEVGYVDALNDPIRPTERGAKVALFAIELTIRHGIEMSTNDRSIDAAAIWDHINKELERE